MSNQRPRRGGGGAGVGGADVRPAHLKDPSVCTPSNGSLNGSELEVQFLEAPEQEGTVPFEPTSACRTVLGV